MMKKFSKIRIFLLILLIFSIPIASAGNFFEDLFQKIKNLFSKEKTQVLPAISKTFRDVPLPTWESDDTSIMGACDCTYNEIRNCG
ncbi:MAG: hypothetical protein QXO84_01140, partial [Candidatus Aenigmatarchaeota archaeon]